ncbi:MAG: flavin reductase family protein [Vulcanimicrobiota bacterium]
MKRKFERLNALYPTPTVLAGALVDGRPNFVAIAHIGIMTLSQISLGINKAHYTNAGIRETGVFSVNIPSEDLVVETDYCGIVSGKKVDKSTLFKVFYGELEKAPMIEGCPVCMECRLTQVIDLQTHEVFIGDVAYTYVEESVLTDDKVDVSRLKPLLFDMSSRKYWSLGGEIAQCWSIGKKFMT